MVVSEKKPIEELLGYLKGAKKVVLVGCGDCATACKTGGEPEIAEMKETLAANGIEVTGSVIIPTACNLLLGKKELFSILLLAILILFSKSNSSLDLTL